MIHQIRYLLKLFLSVDGTSVIELAFGLISQVRLILLGVRHNTVIILFELLHIEQLVRVDLLVKR